MKFEALLFMCNDEKRAEFTIQNFLEHNLDIPLTVYNGGKSALYLKEKYNLEIIEGKNMWQKDTSSPPGSFSYEWFEFMFDFAKRKNPDYLIYLETDVFTSGKITSEPKYDISGSFGIASPKVEQEVYNFWMKHLEDPKQNNSFNFRYHTGCGGTTYSKDFFIKCEKNLPLVKKCYEEIKGSCWADLLMTMLAKYSNCSYGDWCEVERVEGSYRKIDENTWKYFEKNDEAAMIHGYKI